MRKGMVIISMLCAASAAWATLVTDDFNRPNVDYTNDTSQIGPHWKQNYTTNRWSIGSHQVYSDIYKKEAVMYNDGLATTSGGGDSFALKLDYTGRHDKLVWGGIAWNYQDAINFYALRYKNTTDQYQLLTRRNGSWVNVDGEHASSAFADSNFYTLDITSSNAYEFVYSIVETSSGTLMASGTYNPAGSDFTGGYAGLYQSDTGGAYAKFDNFSLEVIPEPATLGLVGICAAGALFIRRRIVL